MLAHEYIDRGTEHAVIILHGIAADHHQLNILHDLPWTTLAIDLPGHGDNVNYKPQPLLEGFASSVQEILAQHGVQRYSLIGYSLGGYLSLDLIQRGLTPEKLVLISSGHTLPYEEQLKQYRIVERALPLLKSNDALIENLIDAYRERFGVHKSSVKGRLDLDTAADLVRALEEEDLGTFCEGCSVPALVVHGKYDMIVPLKIGQQAAQALRAQIEILPENHVKMIASKKMRALVEEFLSSDR